MKTDNELIADFMGVDLSVNHGKPYQLPTTFRPEGTWYTYTLHFHEDWRWLMPVVEKIEAMGHIVHISGSEVTICKAGASSEVIVNVFNDRLPYKSKIQGVYDAVTIFIRKTNILNHSQGANT